jgi:hypothetical protein
MEQVCAQRGKLPAKLEKEFGECFQWVAEKKGWEGLAWPARMRLAGVFCGGGGVCGGRIAILVVRFRPVEARGLPGPQMRGTWGTPLSW